MPTAKIKAAKEGAGKKQPGFFSKFILLGVLPVLYSIGLGMTILHFAGFKVDDQMKWVQEHTKFFHVKKNTQAETGSMTKAYSSKGDSNSQTSSMSNKIAHLKNQSKTVKSKTTISADNQANSSTASTKMSAIAESLAGMDPHSAAKLLINMSESEALKNLKQLQTDEQALIISEMPADAGARFTVALANDNEIATRTDSAAQLYQYMKPEQIASIFRGIKNNEEVLRQIKQLEPNTASKVISQLEPSVAAWIVTHLN